MAFQQDFWSFQEYLREVSEGLGVSSPEHLKGFPGFFGHSGSECCRGISWCLSGFKGSWELQRSFPDILRDALEGFKAGFRGIKRKLLKAVGGFRWISKGFHEASVVPTFEREGVS